MLLCNLAVLLAERNLKITQVSKNTGISRTTLTALANNISQGLQFDTMDKLCMYLKISVNDFFVFHPSSIHFKVQTIKGNDYVLIEVIYKNLKYEVIADILSSHSVTKVVDDCEINVTVLDSFFISKILGEMSSNNFEFGNEWFADTYYPSLPVAFKTDFESRLKLSIAKFLLLSDENIRFNFYLHP